MRFKPILLALATFATLSVPPVAASAAPLDEPVAGPQLVCFKYSTFSLGKGERITDFSGVGEDMTLLVEHPKGSLRISEGEVWGEPEQAKELVLQHDRTTVYRLVIDNEPRYAVYGPFPYAKHKLLIWVSGTALRGTRDDIDIVSRFNIEDTDEAKCKSQFSYSW
jgi:hypothetical protein